MANEKYIHDATPTWNGFNYQGKVGLYVALKKLNDVYKKDKSTDFSKFSLEFEWFEDFAIKYDNKYLSIHQVKAKQSKQKSDYKTLISDLLKK